MIKNCIFKTFILIVLSIYSLSSQAIPFDREVSKYHNSSLKGHFPIYVDFARGNDKQINYLDVVIKTRNKEVTCIRLAPSQVENFKAQLTALRDKYVEWVKTAKENNVKNMTAGFKSTLVCDIYWTMDCKENASLEPKFVVDTNGNCKLYFDNVIFINQGLFSTRNILNWTFINEDDFNSLIEALDLDKLLADMNQEMLFNEGTKYFYANEAPKAQPQKTQKEIREKASKGALKRWLDAAKSVGTAK